VARSKNENEIGSDLPQFLAKVDQKLLLPRVSGLQSRRSFLKAQVRQCGPGFLSDGRQGLIEFQVSHDPRFFRRGTDLNDSVLIFIRLHEEEGDIF
jgi:hypothetical protein